MSNRLLFVCIFSAILSVSSFAQYKLEYHRQGKDPSAFSQLNTGTLITSQSGTGGNAQLTTGTLSTGQSGTGANMDVVYHRINWTLNPNDGTKTVTGTVVTYFKTLSANVSSLSFDLRATSFNNGSLQVTYHGNSCTKSFTGNVLNITLGATIPAAGTLDSITISYQGVPPGVSGAAQGYQTGTYTDQSAVTQRYHTTLSESYEDRDWWPCKADMQDKIDSMDINVTVPWTGVDTFWVAANGKLVDSAFGTGNRTFKFKTRYPIASYLVSLSVGKCNRYYRTVTVGSTNVPVVYNLLAGKAASYYTNALTALDKINPVVVAFSQKYGEYPFKLEKHGFYDGLLGAGGMEHQTMSGIASGSITSLSTLAHELGHQWFGDNVTFATWNDLWLAEGFARYSEPLAAELVPALGQNAFSIRNSVKTAALGETTASAWIPNGSMGTSDLIWNSAYGATVYNRGAMVVSMLRSICGDAKFFQAITNYQTNLAGRSATTDSLKNYINAVLGQDISSFFNDYVGGSGPAATAVGGIGNPVYNIKWNSPVANKLNVRVNTQTQSAGANVTYFRGPVVLHVKGALAANDTTICFYDWGSGNLSFAGNGMSAPIPGNLLSYDLSFTPTSVAYDDSARTLSTGTTTPDATLVGYVWAGGTSTAWNTASNWAACCGVPPTNADVTIATTVNNPILPGPITVRDLTINATKALNIGSNTLTINGFLNGTGTITGSLTSQLVINGKNAVMNFTQTNATTRALGSLSINSGATATLTNALEVTGPVNLATGCTFTINTGVSLLIK